MKVTTKNLLRHAFDTMQELKAGDVDVDTAKAQANLLKQSNNILRYELDKAVAIVKFENIEIENIEDSEEGQPLEE